MKTIGWGFVQIPIVSHYRVCCCIKRDLLNCVTGTGWKMFLQSVLRIALLTLWGMNKIDYSLPQTADLIIGVYVELGILGLQVVDGILTVLSSWFENMYMLYPCLVVIPLSFLVDISVKATCYGGLFLWPHVTSFGVFSLVEVWIRYFTLMYCWIAVISFIYYSRGKEKPFAKKEKTENNASRSSSVRNPFSRSSTLSKRGRRSFHLKPKPEAEDAAVDDRSLLRSSSHTSSSHSNHGNANEVLDVGSTTASQPLIGPGDSPSFGPNSNPSTVGEPPVVPVRAKRKGGFLPNFLKDNQGPSSPSTSPAKEEQNNKRTRPPTLPRSPPVGNSKQWKNKNGPSSPISLDNYKQDHSFFV